MCKKMSAMTNYLLFPLSLLCYTYLKVRDLRSVYFKNSDAVRPLVRAVAHKALAPIYMGLAEQTFFKK